VAGVLANMVGGHNTLVTELSTNGPRTPPGFETVDLTADDDMDMAPITPPPTVSDDEDEMETEEETDLLASPGHSRDSDSDSDGFQHL